MDVKRILSQLLAAVANFVLGIACCSGQTILVEREVVGLPLRCFPSADRPDEYVYLPQRLALSGTPDAPSFTLLTYRRPQATTSGKKAAGGILIPESGGGALSMEFRLESDESAIEGTRRWLRKQSQNPRARLVGPVQFVGAEYNVVSSILPTAAPHSRTSLGAATQRRIVSGTAALGDGNIAVSLPLTPTQTTLLLASLQTRTPDLALQCQLKLAELSDVYDASIVVDMQRAQETIQRQTQVSLFVLRAEAEKTVADLAASGAIDWQSHGEDARSEALLGRAHDKLLQMFFEPVDSHALRKMPQQSRDRLKNLLKINGSAAYRARNISSSTKIEIDFSKREVVQKPVTFTCDLGGLYARFRNDERHFRNCIVDDPTFKRRQVHLFLEPQVRQDVGQIFNSITIEIRKRHGSGAESHDRVVVAAANLAQLKAPSILSYGFDKEPSTEKWLQYEYREKWSFRGGAQHETSWKPLDDHSVTVTLPYRRHQLVCLIDEDAMAKLQVRGLRIAPIDTFFGGQPLTAATFIDPTLAQRQLSIAFLAPSDHLDVGYSLTWVFAGGRRVVRQGRDNSGLLYLTP